MTNETENQDERIIYLYCVNCIINNKNYIGQTVDPTSRWRGHRKDAAEPKVPFHFAIKKHGTHNFTFEVIASCKGQDAANELETYLVKQYDSFVSNNKGYNATHGGMNAPKSEEFKQMMRDWYASLPQEEKDRRNEIHRKNMFKLFEEKGHPCLGRVWTEEERLKQEETRKTLDYDKIYTEDVRKRFSESHIGIKDTEETKVKKAESATAAWDKRNTIRFATEDIRCQAPGCEISGKAKYKIIDGIRYCNKHGLRALRYGRVNLQENRTSHNKGISMTTAAKEKVKLTKIKNGTWIK